MNPIDVDSDEYNAFVDIAQLMMPLAQPFPSNSVLCVSVWQKRILEERYDMASNIFLSIQNEKGDEWLGIGLIYDKVSYVMKLFTVGATEEESDGLADFIPVRTWHHICLHIDLNNQTLSAAINGFLVMQNKTLYSNATAPTKIQVGQKIIQYSIVQNYISICITKLYIITNDSMFRKISK